MALTEKQIERFRRAFDGVCRLLRGRNWSCYNDGTQARDFASSKVANLQDATWSALKAELIGREVADRTCGPERPLHDIGILVRLVGRIALAASIGDSRLLRPGEQPLADAAMNALAKAEEDEPLDSIPLLVAPTENPSPRPIQPRMFGGLIPVEASFAKQRPLSESRKRAYGRAATTVRVNVLELGEAKVAYKLRHPGGWLDIRRYCGAFYRPILAPNAWKPITFEYFVMAMNSSPAWRDHPAARRRKPNATGVVLHLGDVVDDAPPISRAAKSNTTDDEGDFVARCGELVLIDGAIFRRIDAPPKVRLVAYPRGLGTYRIRVAWECGPLASWIDPEPYASQHVYDVVGTGTEHMLPLELESALRACATAINWYSEDPVAADKDGGALCPTTLPDVAALAPYFIASMGEFLGADGNLRPRAEEAADMFARACHEGDAAGATKAAEAMGESILAIVKSSKQIVERNGLIVPSAEDQISRISARAASIAFALAKYSCHLVKENTIKSKDSTEDDAAIAGAFH